MGINMVIEDVTDEIKCRKTAGDIFLSAFKPLASYWLPVFTQVNCLSHYIV